MLGKEKMVNLYSRAENELFEYYKKTAFDGGYNTFGTLKFADTRNRKDLNKQFEADKLLTKFWHLIDSVWFSSSERNKGAKHNRICIRHFGVNGNNLHFHFVAKTHDIDAFSKVASKIWDQMHKATTDCKIEKYRNIDS